ncbi:hypothetical protein LINPERHAP1_LOCUS6950, partial [Linum perenne]
LHIAPHPFDLLLFLCQYVVQIFRTNKSTNMFLMSIPIDGILALVARRNGVVVSLLGEGVQLEDGGDFPGIAATLACYVPPIEALLNYNLQSVMSPPCAWIRIFRHSQEKQYYLANNIRILRKYDL